MKLLSSFFCFSPILFGLVFASTNVTADEIRVAVSGNFVGTMSALVNEFESKTEHRVTIIPGSTGKHYAQITHGAPFDLFFAADSLRPELLDSKGLVEPDSRFTYAIGKLILWGTSPKIIDSKVGIVGDDFRYLAIANPKLAPYGKAAKEVLQAKGLWDEIQGKLVRGENIAQTYQFVASGNADLGFVAYSQLLIAGEPINGSYWEVPGALYSPIEQQAVLLRDGEASKAFLAYVKSDEALEIIQSFGYGTR